MGKVWLFIVQHYVTTLFALRASHERRPLPVTRKPTPPMDRPPPVTVKSSPPDAGTGAEEGGALEVDLKESIRSLNSRKSHTVFSMSKASPASSSRRTQRVGEIKTE